MVEVYLQLRLILRIITYLTYICWEIDNFVIKSDIFRRFFICKNILKKLSCYHDNYFRYFMFGKYNGFVSKARVSACMYFLVTIDGQQSSRLPVNHGVPQGSVLEPILFLLYVNDIPLHLSHSSVDIFADDTTLSASTHWNDIPSMVHDINCDLAALNQWSIQNKMSINDEKTKFMLISGKRLEKENLRKREYGHSS